MATENAPASLNGTYEGHPGYSMPEQSRSASGSRPFDGAETSSAYGNGTKTAGSEAPAAVKQEKKPEVSKDEVGWFFVEQYYTTLSKNPEKLHVSSRHGSKIHPLADG